MSAARWHNFQEVKAIFTDADNVDGYVIFDFRNDRYSLVTVIHWAKTTKQKEDSRACLYQVFFDTRNTQIPKNGTRIEGKNKRSTSSSKPGKDDRQGAPHVIHNDKELAAYTKTLFALTALGNPCPYEEEAIELLTLLVQRYEGSITLSPIPIRSPWCGISSKRGTSPSAV